MVFIHGPRGRRPASWRVRGAKRGPRSTAPRQIRHLPLLLRRPKTAGAGRRLDLQDICWCPSTAVSPEKASAGYRCCRRRLGFWSCPSSGLRAREVGGERKHRRGDLGEEKGAEILPRTPAEPPGPRLFIAALTDTWARSPLERAQISISFVFGGAQSDPDDSIRFFHRYAAEAREGWAPVTESCPPRGEVGTAREKLICGW